MNIFQSISATEFFNTYWQKKPIVFRQAIPDFVSPLDPDELAGLACEEDIESRLVLEEGGEKPWQAISGPFEEKTLRNLAESSWSLSVQGVERILPEISTLLEHFRFLPNWLLDDVLVSYAPDKGSVGAHIDNYDVFIIQGQGKRQWLLGGEPQWNEEYQEGLDIRLLKTFEPEYDWELETGDVLYIPTRFAHHGIAIGECLNYSVGFRAPTEAELVRSLANWAIEQDVPETFFKYQANSAQESSSEISAESLSAIKAHMKTFIDGDYFNQWFGQHISEPKAFFAPQEDDSQIQIEQLQEAMNNGAVLMPAEGLKRAWINDDTPALFIEGESIPLPLGTNSDVIKLICDSTVISVEALSLHSNTVTIWPTLCDLHNKGYFILSD
jgi:50S ribosomal protein L16 3-hydroxylase